LFKLNCQTLNVIIILSWIVIGFAGIRLVISFVNLLTEVHFPFTATRSGPLISVLIPARNEENNIGNLLDDLGTIPYDQLEIIVFNDQSEDNTPSIVRNFEEKDTRVRMIESSGLPEGWLGKNYACHRLAEEAKGKWLLFLDADVRVSGNIAADAISYAGRHNTGLVSVFPRQIMKNAGEFITVPVMNIILCSLLPLILVKNSRYPSLAAANGQFMLFDAATYKRTSPHEKMKNNKVEDIEISRWYKKEKIPTACLLGDSRIECRMYSGYKEAIGGFSKNIICFFGDSVILALAFWLITTFGIIPVIATGSFLMIIIYLLAELIIRVNISAVSRQNQLNNLILALPLQITMGIMIVRAIINKITRKFEWKGRKLYS